jgi:hypothetical protein
LEIAEGALPSSLQFGSDQAIIGIDTVKLPLGQGRVIL